MKQDRQGFTLIELMVVVSIIGILAAVAIPTFVLIVNRSKTAEASSNIKSMFTAVAAYYSGELTSKGIDSSTGGYCTVASAGPSPAVPSDVKQPFGDPAFLAFGFHVSDSVYFSYQLVAGAPNCGHSTNDPSVYTLAASGDLDFDADLSTFELAVGSDASNTLYHSRGLYVANETE